MKIYFTLMGWANDHDQEKITYTTSLLRGDAETWITWAGVLLPTA